MCVSEEASSSKRNPEIIPKISFLRCSGFGEELVITSFLGCRPVTGPFIDACATKHSQRMSRLLPQRLLVLPASQNSKREPNSHVVYVSE